MAARVHFLISGLRRGGAERMLVKLLSKIDRSRFRPSVLSLSDEAALAGELLEMDVPVRFLGMRRGVPSPGKLLRLRRIVRAAAPDLVQTWMYHADLLGGLAARAAGVPVVWNVRHTDLGMSGNRLRTLATAKMCALLSKRLPERIVCCAEAARESHVAFGYDASRMRVIPNGFDVPPTEVYAGAREELGLAPDALVIGLVARFHPLKDHRNFVAAAARLPGAQFVLCGDGVTEGNAELMGWIRATGRAGAFRLLGPRADAWRLAAAFDVATSSSRGEGFPNAVGEAMAAGVPCVVTDTGDSAALVGETGRVVPAGDPLALAREWEILAGIRPEARRALGAAARRRIVDRFSMDAVADRYEDLYDEVLAS